MISPRARGEGGCVTYVLAPKGLMVDSMPELSQAFRYELPKKLLPGIFSENGFEEGYPLNFRHTDELLLNTSEMTVDKMASLCEYEWLKNNIMTD